MTNSQPADDINNRITDLSIRLDQLGDEIDLVKTIQTANRRELRFNSQSLARFEQDIQEIANIVRIQVIQAEKDRAQAEKDRAQAAQDRQQAAIDRKTFTDAINSINQRADEDRRAFQTEIININQRANEDRRAFQTEIININQRINRDR